jgi:hypothetical protein
MTPDQRQLRSLALLMDLKNEGMSPEEAVTLIYQTMLNTLVMISADKDEAYAYIDVIIDALIESVKATPVENFGFKQKARDRYGTKKATQP